MQLTATRIMNMRNATCVATNDPTRVADTAKNATDVLQVVNFTDLLQLVNKLLQACQLGVHRIWNFQIRPDPDLPDSDKNSGRICRI